MEVVKIKITDIKIGTRIREDLGDVEGLAASFHRVGQLQPILITSDHLLIAGGRRLAAAKINGQDDIFAAYRETLSEAELREIELEENLKRKELNWVEEVTGLENLFNLKQEKYGKPEGGRPRSWGEEREGFSQADAAEELERSTTAIGLDLALARAVREYPELRDEKSKASAWKRYKLWKETALRREQASRTQVDSLLAATDEQETNVDQNSDRQVPRDTQAEHKPRQEIRKVGWKGHGTLYLADARDLLRLFAQKGVRVDCIVTDPPFGLGMFKDGQSIGGGRLADNIGDMYDDDPHAIMDMLDEVFMWAGKVLKEDGHAYIFHHMTRYEECFKMVRNQFGTCEETPLIWIKNTPGIGDPNRTWVYAYEPILFVNRGRSLIKPQAFNYLRYDSVPANQRHHPMQKPSALLRHLISASCVQGETVLDPFAGSGSTLVAAYQVGCTFVGCEKKENFHRATVDHISKEISTEERKDEDGRSDRASTETS